MIDLLTAAIVVVYYAVVIHPDAKRRARERQENPLRWN